ncbi:MAG: restriction endonuclease subunit S [Lentisphaerae bacterium]|nr:restriction endonuclease subunit S [Lentisphaerota bacterium]
MSGGTPSKANPAYWEGDIPWVSSREMDQDRIADTPLHITSDAAEAGSRLVPPGTVLAVVRGMSLAKEFRVAITQRQVAFNQDLKAFACLPDVDAVFLFYALLARREYIRDLATEASHGTKKLETDVLAAVEIKVPDVSIQKRIAGILSAYDDLIENNRRRMALLEQAARLLYEEWFVRLRFPGHERTRIVDGLPEGWERVPLAALCAPDDGIQTGPFGSQLHQSDYCDEGVPVVMPKDLVAYRVALDGIARIPEPTAQKLCRHRLAVGDTVYGRRGDIGRRAFVSHRQAGWLCGTGCLRLRPNPMAIQPRYFFDGLGSPETAGTIANRAKGATMPNLNAAVLRSVPLLVAARHLQERYVAQVENTSEQVDALEAQNHRLRAARDLLLPRLMSGEVEV